MTTVDAQPTSAGRAASYDEVVEDLRAGNGRFLEGKSVQSPQTSLEKLRQFAVTGQFPKAIILCCSDSRAPVEMVFDQDVGDLFVIRVAGNIVAPSLVGSIEFAASVYDVNLVLVMGHTGCGAVTAALRHIEDPLSIGSINIHDIVSRITPHILSISEVRDLAFEAKLSLAVDANVLASMSDLSTSSPLIEELVRHGKLYIKGAVMELATGFVRFLGE